ncbi:MAG: hypothetical protein Kow00120_06830 [Anaerolineae bacterium]
MHARQRGKKNKRRTQQKQHNAHARNARTAVCVPVHREIILDAGHFFRERYPVIGRTPNHACRTFRRREATKGLGVFLAFRAFRGLVYQTRAASRLRRTLSSQIHLAQRRTLP